MRTLIHQQEIISLEDKGSVIQMLHDTQMRQKLAEVLNEVTAPRKIEDPAFMKIVADIVRYVLTLFVHEQVTDYKLLAAIL